MTVKISMRTPNPLNGGQSRHWAVGARARKAQRTTTGLVMAGHLRKEGIEPPCSVLLTRYGPSSGLDDDGLQASLKSVRDGVADAFGINDRDPRVTWSYAQRRERLWGVEIRVLQVSQPVDNAPR